MAPRWDPDGQKMLAMCYEDGVGVNKDYKEARRLFALAAKRGVPEAIEGLKRIDELIQTECPLLGKRVIITGTSREDLNGKAGVTVSFDYARGRYVVEFGAGKKKKGVKTQLSLKPGNLRQGLASNRRA